MTTEVVQRGVVTLDSGERFDLTRPTDVLALHYAAAELRRRADQAKRQADEIIRGMLEAGATTILQAGEYEAQEETGKATYDADAIYEAAVAAGVDESIAESQFKWIRQVKDGKELNKLANRQEAWQRARDAGTKRSRGRVVVKKKTQALQAPETPLEIQDVVQEQQTEERAADDIGI